MVSSVLFLKSRSQITKTSYPWDCAYRILMESNAHLSVEPQNPAVQGGDVR